MKGDAPMHETKSLLIKRNGLRCMLCGRKVKYNELNWHHIKPKSVCKQHKEPIDNSYENGALLCLNCHSYVHTLNYWSKEYKEAMEKIQANKKPMT